MDKLEGRMEMAVKKRSRKKRLGRSNSPQGRGNGSPRVPVSGKKRLGGSSSAQATMDDIEIPNEIGSMMGKLQIHLEEFSSKDAILVMETLVQIMNDIEFEFYLSHEESLGDIEECARLDSASSIVSCRMDTDGFWPEEPEYISYFAKKLIKLTLSVRGASFDTNDLCDMQLAIYNLPHLKELMIDLSRSAYSDCPDCEEDGGVAFLKSHFISDTPGLYQFSVKYIT